MRRPEIGSEFWDYTVKDSSGEKYPEWLRFGKDNRYFVSGRTALHHIISDIKTERVFESVYMPSYCCQSMIEPFISNGIKVTFYDVIVNKSGGLKFIIDFQAKCNVVLVMSYFGFMASETDSLIKQFHANGKIVIEDITHSLFCHINERTNADYSFASLRKWLAVPGYAVASRTDSDFNLKEKLRSHEAFVKLRIQGMDMKAKYFADGKNHKNQFLRIFHESEILLANDYENYGVDKVSDAKISDVNICQLIEKRKNNARILIDGLKGNKKFSLLFSAIEESDCPLFVPLLCKDLRDRLKQYLINNNIYCPSHWPVSDQHTLNESSISLYESELSLVCDQRYSTEEMETIVKCISEFRY